MDSLLLEIGTEEIPAGYISPALRALSSLMLQALKDARIGFGDAKTFGTPRRLAICVSDVEDKQQTLTTEIIGPPERIGYDSQGRPTVAALKFAEKVGVPIDNITIRTTKKGNYLCGVKTEMGRSTRSVLKAALPKVIDSIPFPKTMRWADLEFDFARPIQSISSLYGDGTVPFALAGLRSGRYVFGHRFTHPEKIKIPAADMYEDVLKKAGVMVDVGDRRDKIQKDITAAAAGIGGIILPDADLLDTVTHLVEFPTVVVGGFDRKYLELPKEVLITAMREHQKYFAVVDRDDNLMPHFVAISNTAAKDMALVSKGNERVLHARLEDGEFFYQSDLRKSFVDLTGNLKGVLFQAKLGSMYEKVERIQKLAAYLVGRIQPPAAGQTGSGYEARDTVHGSPDDLKQTALRAALLCKNDLVSQMVVEFPKLQGTMGRVYASAQGEAPQVADAIESHYRPTHSGGLLPETTVAGVLAIADKIDTLCGCFSVGLIPTGTSDPYALRRQCIGIVQIMVDQSFSFSLKRMIEKSLSLYGSETGDLSGDTNRIHAFMRSRVDHLLLEEGFPKDIVTAVTSITIDHVPHIWKRVRALAELTDAPDFKPLAIAFKRVVNIIKKAGHAEERAGIVEPKLFENESESNLHEAYQGVAERVRALLDEGSYDKALRDIASMGGAVDLFFDDVMVMAERDDLRMNRLALLKHIADLFGLFADFSKIGT